MTRYILVHGAGHGGWCWDKVAARLRQAGHDVLTPDLPGRAGTAAELGAATMDSYVAALVTLLDAQDGPSVLLGHSMGGLSVTGAAEARPDKVAALVYLTAYAAIDGDSVGSILEGDPDSQVPAATELVADGLAVQIAEARVIPIFYNDLPADEAGAAQAQLVPEPAIALGGAVRVTPEGAGRVAKFYLGCLRDQCIDIAFQRQLAARSGSHWAGEIDAGHSAFLSQPDAVVRHLLSLTA